MAIEDRYKRAMQNTDVLNPRNSKDNAPKPQVYEEQDLFISIADHHYTDVRRDFQAEKCVGLGKLRRMNRIEVAQTNGGTPYHMPDFSYFAFDARNPASSDAACPDPYMQPVDDGRFPANFKRDLCKQISSTVEMRINEDPGDKDYAGTVCGVSSGITGRANGSTSRLQFLDTQTPKAVLKPDFYYGPVAATRAEFNSGGPPSPIPPVGPMPPSNLGRAAMMAAIDEIGHGDVPPKSDEGPDIQKYFRDCGRKTWASAPAAAACEPNELTGTPGHGAQWCAAFISWAYEEGARKLGKALPFERHESVKHLYYHMIGTQYWPASDKEPIDRHKDATIIPGIAFWDPNLIQPGDHVSFYGHATIAISYDPTTNKLETIEGNWGSKVRKVTRDLAEHKIGAEHILPLSEQVSWNIRGFVRPPNI
jgi:hypothetical protein